MAQPHRVLILAAVSGAAAIGFQAMKIEVNNLNQHHSIFNQYMTEIRDVTVQTDSMRFRRNLERAGDLAYGSKQ